MEKLLKFGIQRVETDSQEGQMRYFIYMSVNNQWEVAEMARYPGARVISEVSEDRLMLRTAIGVAARGDVFIVQRFSDLGATLNERKAIMDLVEAMGAQITSAKSNQTISNYSDYVKLLEDVAEAPKERKTKLTKQDLEKAKEMLAEDRSMRYVSKKLGVSHSTISRALTPKVGPKGPKLPDHSEE